MSITSRFQKRLWRGRYVTEDVRIYDYTGDLSDGSYGYTTERRGIWHSAYAFRPIGPFLNEIIDDFTNGKVGRAIIESIVFIICLPITLPLTLLSFAFWSAISLFSLPITGLMDCCSPDAPSPSASDLTNISVAQNTSELPRTAPPSYQAVQQQAYLATQLATAPAPAQQLSRDQLASYMQTNGLAFDPTRTTRERTTPITRTLPTGQKYDVGTLLPNGSIFFPNPALPTQTQATATVTYGYGQQ